MPNQASPSYMEREYCPPPVHSTGNQITLAISILLLFMGIPMVWDAFRQKLRNSHQKRHHDNMTAKEAHRREDEINDMLMIGAFVTIVGAIIFAMGWKNYAQFNQEHEMWKSQIPAEDRRSLIAADGNRSFGTEIGSAGLLSALIAVMRYGSTGH